MIGYPQQARQQHPTKIKFEKASDDDHETQSQKQGKQWHRAETSKEEWVKTEANGKKADPKATIAMIKSER